VEIPDEAIHGLMGWQKEYLAEDRSLRLTPPDQLHITLVFLGQKGEKERDLVSTQLDELGQYEKFAVTASRMVGLPHGRTPRVIAAECEEPTGRLKAIHSELEAGLVAKDLHKPGKREFFPHVTIARSRGRTKFDASGIRPEAVKFTAVRVTLYNSVLKASGAVHQSLKSVQLN